MNKKVLLSTFGLSLCAIFLSSYHDGPAHHGAGNRSGSAGSPNCSTCHGTINNNLALKLTLSDDANSSVVTNNQYIPGHTYTVTLKGDYPGATTYTALGFQASVVNASGANTGTLGVAMANTGTWNTNTGGINVIEHTAPLAKTDTSYIATFKWTAPAAGSGNASVYAALLTSNGDGGPQGDATNIIMGTFSEAMPTAIHDVEKNHLFSIYPNPAKNNINLSLHQLNAEKYDVSIVALDGRIIMHTKRNISGGEMQIDVSSLPKGVYMLTLQSQNGMKTTRFVKQ